MTAGGNMLSAIVEKSVAPQVRAICLWSVGRVTRILINISHQLISCIAHHFPAQSLSCGLAETSCDGCCVARPLAAPRATLITPESNCVFVCAGPGQSQLKFYSTHTSNEHNTHILSTFKWIQLTCQQTADTEQHQHSFGDVFVFTVLLAMFLVTANFRERYLALQQTNTLSCSPASC